LRSHGLLQYKVFRLSTEVFGNTHSKVYALTQMKKMH
jgi:hypothetical protein